MVPPLPAAISTKHNEKFSSCLTENIMYFLWKAQTVTGPECCDNGRKHKINWSFNQVGNSREMFTTHFGYCKTRPA
jgi:hypothetical protein